MYVWAFDRLWIVVVNMLLERFHLVEDGCYGLRFVTLRVVMAMHVYRLAQVAFG